MSQENVELVRRVYDGWSRGDFSEADAFHEKIEFEMVDWPHPAKSRGVEAMWQTWSTSLRAWQHFRSVPTEYLDFGRNVLVLNRIEARGRESGAEVSADTATAATAASATIPDRPRSERGQAPPPSAKCHPGETRSQWGTARIGRSPPFCIGFC